jgi:outer membrane usher protein
LRWRSRRRGCLSTLSGAVLLAWSWQVHPAECAAAEGAAEDNATVPCPLPETADELLLVPRINGVIVHECTYILRSGSRLYAKQDDLDKWRIRPPADAAPLRYRNQTYYPLDAIAGLEHDVDDHAQELIIHARPQIFRPTGVGRAAGETPPTPPAQAGGYFNYDLQWISSAGEQHTDGLFELGYFNRLGTGLVSLVNRDRGDNAGAVRLDAQWTRDWPERMQSLRLGDAISRAGEWGRAVRFGGVQWGRNFATQPGFVTFPLPPLAGEATLPSTLDIYVNNTLQLRENVPQGPFEITHVPVFTGQGEIQLVVRDILGREQLLTQPFYTSQALLREGLQDYSYELGALRRNFGIESNDYGRGFAALTHRAGLTERLTGEVRAEVLKRQHTAGVAATYLVPRFGTVTAATAWSRRAAGDGGLLVVGTQHQTRDLSYSLRMQYADRRFTQIGFGDGQSAPKLAVASHIGFPIGNRGSMTFGYLYQDNREATDSEVFTTTFSPRIGGSLNLSLYAMHVRTDRASTTLGFILTRPFGARSTATLNASRQDGSGRAALQMQQNLPEGRGWGYRLYAEEATPRRTLAELSWQTDIGTYGIEASTLDSADSYRASARGGLALFPQGVFAARQFTDSFALVEVGDYANVHVLVDNQPVAVTDGSGHALVPRLRAYHPNRVAVDPADLPIDAELGALQIPVAPYYRSGLSITFPARRVRGALLTLVSEDGTPLPAGATVSVLGGIETFMVAGDGQAYVTGLQAHNWLSASWREQHCDFDLSLPADSGPLPQFGPIICHGVQP